MGISVLNRVEVVNDAAERGMKSISDFNEQITMDEDRKAIFIAKRCMTIDETECTYKRCVLLL